MFSKFWVCVAAFSLVVAHIYVYTELEAPEEPANIDLATHVSAIWSRMGNSFVQFKNQLRSLLEAGQELTKLAGKNIAKYREERQLANKKKL